LRIDNSIHIRQKAHFTVSLFCRVITYESFVNETVQINITFIVNDMMVCLIDVQI